MSNSLTIIMFAGIFLTACETHDPGWHYEVPEGTARSSSHGGRWYEISKRPGLDARIHASAFAGSLTIELDVRNSSSVAQAIEPETFAARDGNGNELKRRSLSLPECSTKENTLEISAGQRCHVVAIFEIRPFGLGLAGLFRQPNSTLRRIEVELSPLHTTSLVWELD